MLRDSGLQDCRALCDCDPEASLVQGCILRDGRAVELRAEGMRSVGLRAGGRRVEVCRAIGLQTAERLQEMRSLGWRVEGRSCRLEGCGVES